MKLYIAIANTPYKLSGDRLTSEAFVLRERLAAAGYDDSRYTIVEVEVPAPESEAHRVWREKREAALKYCAQSTNSTSSFLRGFDFAYPEPPFAEGGSQADAGVDHART